MPNEGRRNTALDALRGIAILLVLGSHAVYRPLKPILSLEPLARFWRDVGWTGVDLFFVLSGYLVSSLLLREVRRTGKLNVWGFWVRRAYKIIPSYAVLIVVSHLLRPMGTVKILSDLTLMQSYIPGAWGHTWSLSVEEHFYFLIAIYLLVLCRRGNKALDGMWRIIPFLGILCPSLRFVVGEICGYGLWTTLFPSVLRLDCLAFGMGIAFVMEMANDSVKKFLFSVSPAKWAISGALLFVLLTPFLGFRSGRVVNTMGLTAVYLSYGAIVFGAVRSPGLFGTNLLTQTLAFIGRISYNIYLWHVGFLLSMQGIKLNVYAIWAIYVAGSILVGWVATVIIERPFLRLRDKRALGRVLPFPGVVQSRLDDMDAVKIKRKY